MKKIIFGLCALFACFVFTSCSHDPEKAIDQVKDLAKKAEKIKTPQEYLDLYEDFYHAQIDLYKGNPTKKQIKTFNKEASEFYSAMSECERDFKKSEKKELKNLRKEKSFKKKMLELEYELAKAKIDFDDQNKDKDDDDDDDDY